MPNINVLGFEINERETIKKAKKLLKNYERLTLISKSAFSIRSPQLSKTPPTKTNKPNDQIEKFVQKQDEAVETLKAIDTAISRLSEDDQLLIKKKYFKKCKSDVWIATDDFNISLSAFYLHLNKALIHFAEVFGGDLIEWE